MRELHRIIVSGEGGQGIQTLSKALAEAAYMSGKKIAYVPNYGVEQRGGVSLGFTQISNQEIGFPKFQTCDIVIILADRAVPRVKEYIAKDTLVVYDKTLVSEDLLSDLPNEKEAVPAYEIAEKKLNPKAFNMIVLGFVADLIGDISIDNLKKAVNEKLAKKYAEKPEMRHLNEKALEIGLSGAKEKAVI